jgi:hypothetical protein
VNIPFGKFSDYELRCPAYRPANHTVAEADSQVQVLFPLTTVPPHSLLWLASYFLVVSCPEWFPFCLFIQTSMFLWELFLWLLFEIFFASFQLQRHFLFFWVGLGSEFRASLLQRRHSTIWATPPTKTLIFSLRA